MTKINVNSYDECIRSAIRFDEAGEYAKAASYYHRAAEMLEIKAHSALPNERPMFIKSANRLLDAAAEMKRRDRKIHPETSAVPRVESKTPKNDEDEEYIYEPASRITDVTMDDIAGLDEVKNAICEDILNPSKHREIYERFNQKSNGGILLYGLPGTGKTMMARCIATESKADFFPILCSDIVGKWFGEAERRVKALFDAARRSENAIIFFDEFEALACKRGGNSTVMNRLVPELLAQMDGFRENENSLIVIAATNRPWDIDEGFFRYPRLTRHIYVSLPDAPARLDMFKKLLAKMPCDPAIDIDWLAEKTEGFTCADITNLINRSTRLPIKRCIENNSLTEGLTFDDIKSTLPTITPSVRQDELARMDKWRSMNTIYMN